MNRRIVYLIEEQENRSNLFRTKNLDVEVERTQEDLKHLSIQESRAPTPDREEVLSLNPTKYHQQCEVIMPREDKNQSGKRNPVMQIIGKKARNLNKKKTKLSKLQAVPVKTFAEGRSPKFELYWNIIATHIGTS
jgi:hypothetical protein